MIDRAAQEALRPLLVQAAAWLRQRGCTADGLTWLGFGLGLCAAALIALQQPGLALPVLLLSRLCDGLDGALARLTKPSDRGAFLDITLDFLFYASIPLGFAVADPATNALPAAVLLAAFIGTGSSFLAYAVLAAKRGITASTAQPAKGFFYLGGLTEAGETLLVFCAMCLWPSSFALLAWGFAALCMLTVVGRLRAGWRELGGQGH
jgi:phosphatidylglycerophosphate synthase